MAPSCPWLVALRKYVKRLPKSFTDGCQTGKVAALLQHMRGVFQDE